MDNNTKLDGLEMLHAIQHSFHHDDDDHEAINETSQIPFIVGKTKKKYCYGFIIITVLNNEKKKQI